MYVKTSYPEYLDTIYDGPYILKKLVPQIDGDPKHHGRKTKAGMTPEVKNELLKDVKVKNILHNRLLCLTR